MEIRQLQEGDDISAIANILALCWKEAYGNFIPRGYMDKMRTDRWEETFRQRENRVYILWEEGRYCGVACACMIREGDMAGWGEIVSLYVLPECWGRGYGKALLRFAMQALGEMGAGPYYLWVFQKNANARRFYERQGFRATGVQQVLEIGGANVTEEMYVLKEKR